MKVLKQSAELKPRFWRALQATRSRRERSGSLAENRDKTGRHSGKTVQANTYSDQINVVRLRESEVYPTGPLDRSDSPSPNALPM